MKEMTEKTKKGKRNQKILFQVGGIIFVLFTVAAIINGISIYRSSSENYKNMLYAQSERFLNEARDHLLKYKAYPWLVEYWQTNRDKMHLTGDADERKAFLNQMLVEHGISDLCDVTPEQAEAFNEKEQQYFAEGCYMDILLAFSSIKKNFKLTSLTCVMMDESYKPFPLFHAGDEELTKEEDYGLGQVWPFHKELHPAIMEMFEKKEDRAYFEEVTSTLDGVEYLFGYVPVMVDGSFTTYVNAYFPIEELRAHIMKSTQKIEMINVTLLFTSALVFLLLVYQVILKPLLNVQHNVREYRVQKDSQVIVENLSHLRSNNEVGRMADDFSEMAMEMDKYSMEMIEMTAESERVNTELNMAANIQLGFLPNIYPDYANRSEFDLFATMDPAKEVGGDFYDFYFVDEDHIALVIADVSGKGVPASLFMVIAKTLIKMQSQSGKSPAQIFSEANNMLCEGNDQVLFVTCWLAVIELSTGKGIVANAGHVHPCFRRAGKAWELLEYDHDLPLAVMEDAPFQEHILSLEPGDSLYVYTDGVTEAMAGNGEQFGEERLLDALNEESESSPEKFLVHVKERIDGFIGEAPQFDDLTMLGITWKGRDNTL